VKRVLYILSVLLVSILLVSTMLLGVLMSDEVETAAVQLATSEFSHALGTHASVGAVEYRFPARIRFRDIYMEDQQGDTLAFVGEIYAHFSPLSLRNNEIRFHHVRLNHVVSNLYRLPSGEWNYAFLTRAFASKNDDSSDPLQSLIAVRDIQLDSIRLRYEDYHLFLSHAEMDLYELSESKIDAEISKLALQIDNHQSSFVIEDTKAHVILNDTMLSVPVLRAQLPQSRMDMSGIEVHFPAGDTLYLSKSAHEITFALRFNEAQIVPAELALFVPKMKNLKRPVGLSGGLSGTLDSLAFEDLEVRYNGKSVLRGDIQAVGLPDINNPYLRANLADLQTNAAQLQDFLSQLNGRPVRLPQPIHRLGNIRYRGQMEGYLQNMTLHGAFRTALGAITTDGSFKADSTFEVINYNAKIVARNFRLGRMLANDKLGTVTLDVTSKGTIENGDINGDVLAHVRQLTYNDYTYADLTLDGHYAPQHFHGNCAIHDPHLDASFEGVVDLHATDPEINFNLLCAHFDSAPLGLAIGDRIRSHFSLNVDMSGSKADEVSGYLVIDSFFMATSRDSVLVQQLMLLASADPDGSKTITFNTDFLRTQLDGRFRYEDIVPAAQAMMHYYLPTAVKAPKKSWKPVEFTLKADGDRLRDVQRLFNASITLSDHPKMSASVRVEPKKEPSVDFLFYAPGVRYKETPVHDLTITLNSIDSIDGLALSVSAEAMEMYSKLNTVAFRDSLLTGISVHKEAQLYDADQYESRRLARLAAQRAGNYGGDLQFITHFSQYNRRPLIDMHFMPGTLLLRDSVYTLGESRVTYCAADTSVTVENFAFEGGGQHIYANGLASRRATDTLFVDLLKLDASYIVPFVLAQQTIMFNGLLTGQAYISGVFSQPKVDTQIHVDSMGLNNCWFGDAEVDLHITDTLGFHADVYRTDSITQARRTIVDLYGKAMFDKLGRWELDMQTDSVPLAFVNHWTKTVLRDLDGHGTGRVVVGGRKGMVYVLLNCAAQNASLTLPWTGARYTIAHDTIKMDTTAILFPNVHLTDAEGNAVEVNGAIHHDQFKTFNLDLHVDAHDALVFDQNNSGEMMQGSVYANGHVDVTGPDDDILVVADAVTSRNSRFRLSLDNVSSAYESTFVHFVEHPEFANADSIEENDLDNIDIKYVAKVDTSFSRGRCLLKLNIEVNPQLLFQLVIGERNGDIIQAHGSGALSLTYDTETGDVSLLGTYAIDHGTLSYTVANVIKKEFTVGEGSTIVFSGDATNPQLDVVAKYKVTANLRDLFGSDAQQLATSRSNIPVMTCMHLTGPLNNPILSFSLEFPTSDQSIQQQVQQIINTDEMLMRQVIYLLVFGRFFAPENMSNSQSATLNSTYSLLSSTVTGQINSWLSKLTDMLTVGVAIRMDGEGDDSSQEYEAQFQLHPVDRLVINGNVGYRYNDVSNQPFFGDLDVEVLLTADGQLRLKGYTHTVDKYSLRQASTIQGVGFVWKKDF